MNLILLALILGLVQAVTEFLPISSTGHLILAKELFNFDSSIFNLSFDIILHFGTLAALVVFFRQDLKKIVLSFFRKSQSSKLFYTLIIATIPAIFFGAVFSKLIENNFRNSMVVVFTLFAVGALFIIVENISKKLKNLESITFKDAIFIGLAQASALIPGVSRSGITITAGLFLGLKREEAAKFSFLLSIPTIFLVSIKDIYDLSKLTIPPLFFEIYVVGFIVSAIVSFLVIKFFLNYLIKHTLKPFAYYRFALASVVLFLLFLF